MPVLSTTKMTARQYLLLGDDPPGVRLELVNGEIAVSASPMPRHSYVNTKLLKILANHIDDNDLGLLINDTDTVFGEYDVRRPDLIYFTKARMQLVEEDDAIRFPPDLCVEILSPSSIAIDRADKFEQYAAGKVKYYWIVDPMRLSIEGFRLVGGKYKKTGGGAGDELVTLPPFPDLKIPLADLWFPKSK